MVSGQPHAPGLVVGLGRPTPGRWKRLRIDDMVDRPSWRRALDYEGTPNAWFPPARCRVMGWASPVSHLHARACDPGEITVQCLCMRGTLGAWTYTIVMHCHNQQQKQQRAHSPQHNQIWGRSVFLSRRCACAARSLHPTPGVESRSLPPAGGPTQPQLSRPKSSGHHISMEHRPRTVKLGY